MPKHTVVSMPGDGIGNQVLPESIRVLNAVGFDAEYIHADIGWDIWCREGNALPDRTIQLLEKHKLGLFGAITSKPNKAAQAELKPELQGKGYVYYSPDRDHAPEVQSRYLHASLRRIYRQPAQLRSQAHRRRLRRATDQRDDFPPGNRRHVCRSRVDESTRQRSRRPELASSLQGISPTSPARILPSAAASSRAMPRPASSPPPSSTRRRRSSRPSPSARSPMLSVKPPA